MRKWLLIVLLPFLLVPLSGCDYHELDNTVFAVGMGIERAPDGGYRVSVEIISMSKGNQETYEPQVAMSTGKTMLEATSNIRGLISQKLDFTHCHVILFDEQLAEDGIKPLVRTMLEFNEIDINTLCMVTVDCTPQEVFSAEPLTTRAQSFELRSTIVDEQGVEKAIRASLLWLDNSINEDEGTSILPMVRMTTMGDKKVAGIHGSVVLRHGQKVGLLTREEMLFFLVAEDTPHNRMLSVPFQNGYLSARIEESKSKREAKVVGSEVEVRFQIDMKISFIDGLSQGVNLEEARADITAYLTNGIKEVIDKGRNEMGCDLHRIAMKLYQRYPGLKGKASGWREDVQKARYEVEIVLDIETDDML